MISSFSTLARPKPRRGQALAEQPNQIPLITPQEPQPPSSLSLLVPSTTSLDQFQTKEQRHVLNTVA